MPAEATIGPLRETLPDFFVEVVALSCLHGDVAGEGVKQSEILLGVVAQFPVEVANDNVLEEPDSFDLAAIVGQFGGSWTGCVLGQTLADLVVDLLELDEEWVTAVGEHVGGAPEGEMPAGAQQLPGPLVSDRRIDPVPCRCGKDEIEPISDEGLPGLESALGDGHIRECGEVAAGSSGKICADLDAGDLKTATG